MILNSLLKGIRLKKINSCENVAMTPRGDTPPSQLAKDKRHTIYVAHAHHATCHPHIMHGGSYVDPR